MLNIIFSIFKAIVSNKVLKRNYVFFACQEFSFLNIQVSMHLINVFKTYNEIKKKYAFLMNSLFCRRSFSVVFKLR